MTFQKFIEQLVHITEASRYSAELASLKLVDPEDWAYAQVLAALGLVTLDNGGAQLCDRDNARFFLDAWIKLIDHGRPLLGSLNDVSMPWVSALRAIEKYRTQQLADFSVLRVQKVEQVIIVGLYGDRRYLLVEDQLRYAVGWSEFKLVGARSQVHATDFREQMRQMLGAGSDRVMFGTKPIALDVTQISATRGAHTRYEVQVFCPIQIPQDLHFHYPAYEKKLAWIAVDDLWWGIEHTPEVFFPKVFETDAIRQIVNEVEHTYAMEPFDLEMRRVTREAHETLVSKPLT
jgi:hypothetical protein